jgi:hypothetical protein
MDIGAKKLNLIEEVLKIENNSVLIALEEFLKASKNPNLESNNKFSAFSGIWSDKEALEVKEIISASCENTNLDDWK